jgi:hypothetical protein
MLVLKIIRITSWLKVGSFCYVVNLSMRKGTVIFLYCFVRRGKSLKNPRTFLAKFLPASLLGVCTATGADNSGELIGNELNSDGAHSRSENGRSGMGCVVRYHPVTVTSTQWCCFVTWVSNTVRM